MLRAGDWVEVKSADRILATLDERGRLDALPFMPEMLAFCGQRFQVYKSAHKACDTSHEMGTLRGLDRVVHLAGVRCDGNAHGGCQAECLLYWKEEWLQPVGAEPSPAGAARADRGTLDRETRNQDRYQCQITALHTASRKLHWWDPRHYVRDLFSGNVQLWDFLRFGLLAMYNAVARLHWRLHPHPYVRGRAGAQTPTADLGLQAGDLVQVRSRDEIMDTLNGDDKNRGLSFDPEMVPYCGKTMRVRKRVERIVNERTGEMMRIPGVCLMLEGVTCGGCLSKKRMFCPRSIYSYWHEVWLKRV